MSATTLLGLSLVNGDSAGFSLSPYATRGIEMDCSPIDGAGDIQRDINANLIDWSNQAFRKLKAKISCADQESPGFAEMSSAADGIWPGSIFDVTFIPQLGLAEQMTVRMMVMAPGWQVHRAELSADTSWSLDLEEI